MDIKLSSIIKISEENLPSYKLHLAAWNKYAHPLDVYLESWEKWVGWNKYKEGKNDFSREYIFSLIHFYHEPNRWLFGGIFKVLKRNKITYTLELEKLYEDLIGRLIVDFYRYQGMRGRAFYLENYFNDFKVSEILKKPYDGEVFPGYENIDIDFTVLEQIYKIQKVDWKGALENVKGVYMIIDKKNGKKYIGSAYGTSGIWSRWNCYVQTGHGYNDELTRMINKKGIKYARDNFKLSLLEYRPMKTDDQVIIAREAYWKNVMLSRNFGYNMN